jgi:MOSC domain-containing protein YiiM
MIGTVAQIASSGGGVPKRPVTRATVDLGGVVGDRQRSRVHHGRQWQGLCLYSRELLDALRDEGHPIDAGCIGENLTLTGLEWSRLRGGVIVEIGDVRCRLTAAAAPCTNIAAWFRDGDFTRVDHQRHPGWSRWYATVLSGGTVTAGDRVRIAP